LLGCNSNWLEETREKEEARKRLRDREEVQETAGIVR
jgi:hypothetical protein